MRYGSENLYVRSDARLGLERRNGLFYTREMNVLQKGKDRKKSGGKQELIGSGERDFLCRRVPLAAQ